MTPSLVLSVLLCCGNPALSDTPPASAASTAEQVPAAFLRGDVTDAPAIDLERAKAAARYSAEHSGRAVLVMQNGTVVFEDYANGWSASKLHPLASGTKSFTGILAMAAIEDGLLSGLDELVSDTINEWKEDSRKSKITVRHLLSLSSGLEPDDPSLGRQGAGIRDLGAANNLAGRLRDRRESMPENRFAAAVNIPATSDPGERFRYGPSHYYAFGELLSRKLKSADRPEKNYWEYLRARVLVPAGIDIPLERFAPDRVGNPNLPGGGHLTALEWARFGEFVRLGGATRSADGSLEPSFKEGSFEPCFAPSKANTHYGLTWWLLNGEEGDGAEVADTPGASGRIRERFGWMTGNDRATRQAAQIEQVALDGKPVDAVMAAGAGKQRLYLIPQLGLVVVRFAEMNQKGQSYDDGVFLKTLLGSPEATANVDKE